jgi:two-component system cell cycle response regulator DivK
VEDNEINRDMLSRRLSRRGYSVTIAADGAQAIEIAARTLPDLILMDMSMPVLDGWEASRRLKANPELCRIPIIALTAHAMSDDRSKAMEAGCDEYDTKPVEFSRLLQKMEALLVRTRTTETTSPLTHDATVWSA